MPYGRDENLEKAHNVFWGLEDARSAWLQKTGADTRGNQDHKLHVSNDLKNAGLPGIKYLDQGSRVPPPNLDPDHIKGQIERNRAQAAQTTDEAHRADLDDDHQILLDRLAKADKMRTRNYVVFDDKLVNVKRKYAAGGMVEDENAEETDKDYQEGRTAEGRIEGRSADKGRNQGRSRKLHTGPGGRGPGWASAVKPADTGPIVERALMVISRKAKSLR